MLVAGTSVPVLPCFIEGAFAALPPGRRWPKPSPVRVRIGEPLLFATFDNDKAGWIATAGRLESAVRALAGGATEDPP